MLIKYYSDLKMLPLFLAIIVAGCNKDQSRDIEDCKKGNKKITTINNVSLPGTTSLLQNVNFIRNGPDGNGMHVSVAKGDRTPNTRVGIHIHEHGGYTCVVEGEIKLYVQGQKDATYLAGDCYYMPPNVFMAAYNPSTTKSAKLIDVFRFRTGDKPITYCEPGTP